MVRSLALVALLALAPALPAAPAMAGGPSGARQAAIARLMAATGVEIADSKSECRAECDKLRTQCSGSQCRAAYAACIARCR